MMAAAGSLQFPRVTCKSHQHYKKLPSALRRGSLNLFHANPSSLALQQDLWSVQLSYRLYRPTGTFNHRCNLLKCHSFLNSGPAFDSSTVKSSALTLLRSCSGFPGGPSLLKVLSAVGIVVFALWGLGPLLRQTRYVFLRKSDNSWKRSHTHYVLTSYLQPLLLWAGATLICRALDPLVLPSEASQIVKQRVLAFVKSLSTVLAFAFCLSSVIQQVQKFFMETNDPTNTRNMGFQFAGKAVYTAVWVAAVSLFMELLGFSTQKWLTAGGLGTVLLTLAGREIFTNFLSSVMIHATRPFVVNEWIQTKIEGYEVSGTVEHVGWWSPTIVRGEDREAVHIPNHKFTMNVVRNLSQKAHWRIKTHLAISHLDVNKINNIVADMRKVLAKNPQVEQQRLHRRVFLENINPENQALLILVSCFVKTSHFEEYLCVKEAILLDLLRVISHHRARLATPIRTVQKIYSDADSEGMPVGDSVSTRRGPSSNHPLLLIEPHYKINGEDKNKSQALLTLVNGEQENKASGKLDNKPEANTKAKDRSTGENKFTEKEIKASDSEEEGAKVIEKSNLDTKEKHKVTASSSVPDLMTGDKTTLKLPSKSLSQKDSVSVESSNWDNKVTSQEVLSKRITNEKQAKIGDKKLGGSGLTSESKQEKRPALEENIVLGVALEGSKRTLLIEEGMNPYPAPTESSKELTTFLSGSGSTSTEKDPKDGKNLSFPTSTSADQQKV